MENKFGIRKILLVDDDIDFLETTRLLMELEGLSVVTAESGLEGWEKFQTENPDACVIDLMMEEMDSGFVLCYRIKGTARGEAIPVLMLTSSAHETGYKFSVKTEYERQWIKCDDFLNKPVIVSELLEKIENFYEPKEK